MVNPLKQKKKMNYPKTINIKLEQVKETTSTNDYLAKLCKENKAKEFYTVVAESQTNGKGQRGNTWEAESGKNLTFSMVLYPTALKAKEQFSLSMVAALSCHQALGNYTDGFSIKWPNDIYFGEEGMTSTSAQHVSAMANVMVQDIKQHIMGLRLYQKSIRVIGDAEVTVETVNNTLPEIAESVKRICKANALIAWLREAVKEREQAQKYVSDMSLDDWMKKQGIEKPVSPEPPQMPRINFQDYKTILDTGLSVKEYNRFVELNSALAVYGEMIHEKGLLTRQKSELARIMQNPTEVKESGRDTIITRYEADDAAVIDEVYTELQARYRKLQAEKNGIEAKFSNLAMDYQTRKNDEWKAAKAQYDRDLQKVNSELVGIQTQMKDWKKQRLEELAALKIIIPDALKPLYKELKVKYL